MGAASKRQVVRGKVYVTLLKFLLEATGGSCGSWADLDEVLFSVLFEFMRSSAT